MNLLKLNEILANNTDAIYTILENLGCENITYNSLRNELRCSRDIGTNPSSVRINADTLKFICFSTGEKGDIYNFIMQKKKISFPNALKWVAKILNLDERNLIDAKIQLPFGGFYKKLSRDTQYPELTMSVYDSSVLNEFNYTPNLRFFKDGIDFKTQERFKLGYDMFSHRITIPQWSFDGEIVGVMGRSNDDNIPYDERWLPIIPCSRSYTLFGYHQNYNTIQRKQLCIIVESEKGVMQMSSMGYNCGVATCTRRISNVQARYLKAMKVDRFIIAYDQGIPEEDLIAEAQKIKVDNSIYKNQVGYIYDSKGDILSLSSKESPTDKGVKNFKKLINQYTRWL